MTVLYKMHATILTEELKEEVETKEILPYNQMGSGKRWMLRTIYI